MFASPGRMAEFMSGEKAKMESMPSVPKPKTGIFPVLLRP
jgi:hypothetical protein